MVTRSSPKMRREVLEQIPVIKLPASKLEACLTALGSAPNQLRSEVWKNIQENVYPGFDEKRAFRALVAPALTRLHFARSEPPFFRPAPNARIWMTVDKEIARSYTALVLFDFAEVRLRIREEVIPPSRSLRESAKAFGPRFIDRIRGLDVMLRFYESFRHIEGGLSCLKVPDLDEIRPNKPFLRRVYRALKPGTVTAIDEARYLVMKRLLDEKVLSSSFVVDELFRKLIQTGRLIPFRGAYSAIDSLIVDGTVAGALVSVRGV